MSTIKLTDNATLNITASTADRFATLNRYLLHPLTLLAPAGFKELVATKIGSLDPTAFPVEAGIGGAGAFAVGATSLELGLGVSASVGLLTGADAADFLGAMQWTADPSVAGLVSFRLKGTLSAGDTAGAGDFSFGIEKAQSVALTSYCPAPADELLTDALVRAIVGLTIPHDVDDLRSLPSNTICRIAASGSLSFTASITYSILNNPLATMAISKLPPISVNATAGATLEATATHSADHTVTIAKLPDGRLHLSVHLKKTDDLETSLTASVGVTGKVGDQDALAFLLARISPNSTVEMKKLRTEMPADQAEDLSSSIKDAIDAALSNSLQVSLKAALDRSRSNSRLFLYEIDLGALNGDSTAALQAALRGDFTTLTKPNVQLAGIRELDSALTITSAVTHTLAVHLLGIFNWADTSTFIKKSKVDYTLGTSQIVLSDETVHVAVDNLRAEKLREAVLKGITLTLPASANTPEADTPITTVFFDRQAGTGRSAMHQFVNVLNVAHAPDAAAATSLLGTQPGDFGTTSLYLGLSLTPQQCRQLFLDSAGRPYEWTTYLRAACDAMATILFRDADNEDRVKLFGMDNKFWNDLRDAGATPNVVRLLADHGIRQNASVDVTTLIWWASAMADYSKALAEKRSLEKVGEEVVKDSTRGFNEPWMTLATWNLVQNPPLQVQFSCSLLQPAAAVLAKTLTAS